VNRHHLAAVGARGTPTFRIGLVTLSTVLLLIVVGGFTRGSGSGYGCADRWPLCEGGLAGGWLPRADYHMIVEWSHRWLAAVVGVLVIATAASAWRHDRHDRVVPLLASVAVLTLLFQAWLGRAVVRAQLDADLVSLHLAISLALAGLLTAIVILVRFGQAEHWEGDRSWPTLVMGGAGAVLAVIMLGSLVHNQYFSGWPLMSGALVPELNSTPVALHFAHRLVSGLVAFAVVGLWWAARRRERPDHEVTMLGVAATLYLTNVLVGAAHVFTQVGSAAIVALHLGLAATVWVLTAATAVSASRISGGNPDPGGGSSARLAGHSPNERENR
jgi:heme a synthase